MMMLQHLRYVGDCCDLERLIRVSAGRDVATLGLAARGLADEGDATGTR